MSSNYDKYHVDNVELSIQFFINMV